MRRLAGLVLVLIAVSMSGCGSGEMSMTEYGETIDDAAARAGEGGARLFAAAAAVPDPTPAQVREWLEQGLAEIRIPLQETVDAIDPPAPVADLHDLMWSWHARLIATEQSLIERVAATPDTEAGWTALSASPEMEAYRATIAEGKQICDEFQARLDATEVAGAFAGTPWTPAAMQEVVEAALGCHWFPEDTASIYRYPPAG